MRLRPEQMRQMDEAAQSDFHRRLAAFLREELPEETAGMDDRALRLRIEQSERRAAERGIMSEAGVAQFTCLTFSAGGPRFDEHPLAQSYFEEPGDPEEKLDALADAVAAERGAS